jgi:segregation and condensation protein A
MSFQLKTSYFEGPLELLLSLIEEKKLHISEISLAQVTEDYLNYINAISESSKTLLDRSQFVVVAATLILIKARSLVPTIELSQEETESIDDLTERLRLYEIVKRYGELFAKQFNKKPSMYRGNPPREKKVPVFTPHESLTIELIVTTLHEVCAALPVVQPLPEKSVKVTITLADVMDRVQKAISSGASFSLSDATNNYRNATTPIERREAKVFAVLSFLAVLEMVKKSLVLVEQEGLFNDIIARPYQEIENIE